MYKICSPPYGTAGSTGAAHTHTRGCLLGFVSLSHSMEVPHCWDRRGEGWVAVSCAGPHTCDRRGDTLAGTT